MCPLYYFTIFSSKTVVRSRWRRKGTNMFRKNQTVYGTKKAGRPGGVAERDPTRGVEMGWVPMATRQAMENKP